MCAPIKVLSAVEPHAELHACYSVSLLNSSSLRTAVGAWVHTNKVSSVTETEFGRLFAIAPLPHHKHKVMFYTMESDDSFLCVEYPYSKLTVIMNSAPSFFQTFISNIPVKKSDDQRYG